MVILYYLQSQRIHRRILSVEINLIQNPINCCFFEAPLKQSFLDNVYIIEALFLWL